MHPAPRSASPAASPARGNREIPASPDLDPPPSSLLAEVRRPSPVSTSFLALRRRAVGDSNGMRSPMAGFLQMPRVIRESGGLVVISAALDRSV